MEEGYTAVDDAAITVKSDQKVFLFRFPKDVSLSIISLDYRCHLTQLSITAV